MFVNCLESNDFGQAVGDPKYMLSILVCVCRTDFDRISQQNCQRHEKMERHELDEMADDKKFCLLLTINLLTLFCHYAVICTRKKFFFNSIKLPSDI